MIFARLVVVDWQHESIGYDRMAAGAVVALEIDDDDWCAFDSAISVCDVVHHE